MYVPQHFREERTDVLHRVIEENGFATVVTPSPAGIVATHIPILLDWTRGPLGTLRGHVARANPHWTHLAGSETLVIFRGPHAYISPSWYATRGRVPTWNYVAVHAYGTPHLTSEPAAVQRLIEATIDRYEGGFERPWDISALDPDAVTSLLEGVVAFEIPIARLEGKRKLGQNRSRSDREGMVRGLRTHGRDGAKVIADLVEADLASGGRA